MRASRLSFASRLALGVIACTLLVGAQAASAGTIHVFSGSFTADTGAHALSQPAGIAVNDETGDVYVVDVGNKRVEELNSTGTVVLAEFAPTGGFSSPEAIAVDNSGSVLDPSNGDVYVTDTGSHVVDKFSATGTYEGQLAGTCENTGEVAVEPGACTGSSSKKVIPFEQLEGVAVDPAGAVWVYQENRQIDSYSDEEPSKFLSSRESPYGTSPGFAVDSNDNLYVKRGQPYIGKLNRAGEPLIEEMDNEASAAVAVDASNDDVYVDNASSIGHFDSISGCTTAAPCVAAPTGSLIERFGTGHLSESAGVAVNSSTDTALSGTVYATDRSTDSVTVYTAMTVPDVTTGTASQAGQTSEILHGTVNPAGLPVTECRFEYAEYGAEKGVYQHTAPCEQTPDEIGDGTAAAPVNAEISGLKPASTYDFRLTAVNANGSVNGGDEAVTVTVSLGPAALSLPDGRAYELVSTIEGTEVDPPKSGQPYERQQGELNANQGGFRAAANGEVVAYDGGLSPSGVGGYGVARTDDGNLYLSERGANGWSESDIDPVPGRRLIEGFSADLSQQFINISEPQFNNTHGQSEDCEIIYGRSGGVGAATFQSLVSDTAVSECAHPTFAGTSADDSHLLFQSPDAYTQGAFRGEGGASEEAFGTLGAEGYDNLYDSVAGRLYQVNIMPDGKPESSPYAVFGGRMYLGIGGDEVYEHDLANDISADGSRIFWTSLDNKGNRALYVRENDTRPQSSVIGEVCAESAKACTIQLDRTQPGAEGTSGGGTFWTSSSDGSRVFFTDCSRLTAGSTAVATGGCSREIGLPHPYSQGALVPAGNDLYEYDLDNGRLADLTVDHNSADSLGADVQGVIGVSEDGSYVYFVANGVLAGENTEGRMPVTGQPNLYVSHDGDTRFVVTLEIEDERFSGNQNEGGGPEGSLAGDWRLSPGLRTASISQDGGVIAFMSRVPLTGYDNLGCKSIWRDLTARCPEVFVYSSHAERVSCASCAPSGAPPVAAAEHWEDQGGGHVGISGNNTFGLRWLNAEGTQVYFDSSEPLVTRDTNDHQDVYEWESEGIGGCERVEGCINLLSGGDDPRDAFFLDASESGNDVFFTSSEQLLPDGGGEFVKLYDARVDGGFPELEQACTGTGCQGNPPAPPIFATPSSVTFEGIGDFPPPTPVVKSKPKSKSQAKCRKHFVKKKGRCVKLTIGKRTKSTRKGRK